MRFVIVLLFSTYGCGQMPAVHLRLGTVDGETQFHIGQAIPVTLDFETDSPLVFRVNTDVRLRRLRPQGQDVFSVSSGKGWADPLGSLRWTIEGAVFGAALPVASLDSLHPVRIERDLNEFIVFRKPGNYVVQATSTRVIGQMVHSNNLSLSILPRDDVWTAAQLTKAKAILEAGAPPKQPQRVFHPDKENAQIDAVRTLRFLETEEAAAYLASIYGRGRETDGEIEFALFSSPYPDAIAKSLEQHLADSDLGVSQSYLTTLEEIQAGILVRRKGRQLSQAEWSELGEAINKKVFELAAHKSPRAQADTYFFLFVTGSKSFRDSPEVRGRLIESMPAASTFYIQSLLDSYWVKIQGAGRELVPVLKEIIGQSRAPSDPGVAGLALLRLSQLDEQAAKDIAWKELLSGGMLIDDRQLLEFSFAPSRELDEALLLQYRKGKPVDARIARFASADIKEEVWRAYEARRTVVRSLGTACPGSLFAYFFRVDPEAAARRLSAMREGEGACTSIEIYGLERQLMNPGLEQQLITDARSSEQNVRQSALRALSMAGSPTALPPLLAVIHNLSDSKEALILAVVHGRNWFLTAEQFAELKAQCSGTPYCNEVSRIEREQSIHTLRVFDLNGHNGFWLSNQEIDSLADLEKDLSQFPKGTVFHWQPNGNSISAAELAREKTVGVVLAAQGMVLED